jgi:hypothetical protein
VCRYERKRGRESESESESERESERESESENERESSKIVTDGTDGGVHMIFFVVYIFIYVYFFKNTWFLGSRFPAFLHSVD